MIPRPSAFLHKHLAGVDAAKLPVFQRAKGVHIFDLEGRPYFDLISGIGVNNVGHCHPRILRALDRQQARHLHLSVYGEGVATSQEEFAAELVSTLDLPLQTVLPLCSGSEAIEASVKLARLHTRRSKIIHFQDAYHGSTAGALSLCGNREYRRVFDPFVSYSPPLGFNDVDALQGIDDRTAAVVVETVQGEAGVRVATREFGQRLRRACQDQGALLILDEIQCGMGRTGRWWAWQGQQIIPDILVAGKALGGGMPLSCVATSPLIMESFWEDSRGIHLSTFAGHPGCCAAGAEVFRIIRDESLLESVEAKAERFVSRLAEGLPHVVGMRHAGLLMALDLGCAQKADRVVRECLSRGVITDTFLFSPASIRISPPLTITTEQIDEICEVIAASLKSIPS